MTTEPLKESSNEKLSAEVGSTFGRYGVAVVRFIRTLPEPIIRSILDDPIKQKSVPFLCTHAPKVMEEVAADPMGALPIMEGMPFEPSIECEPLDALPKEVAKTYRWIRCGLLGNWTLDGPDMDTGLTPLAESLIAHAHRRLQLSFAVFALGSFASGDLAPSSNLNVLLVAQSRDGQRNELEAHALLGFFQGLKHYGAECDLDIQRIGGKLYIEEGGLSGLAVSALPPEEYVALATTRPLIGEPERTIEPTPMTPERLRNLVKYKRRMETELVQARYRRRHVKFGEGALSDIEWILLLHEARFPTATDRARSGPISAAGAPLWKTVQRIRKLSDAQLLTPMERDELIAAHAFLIEARIRLYLLDLHIDVIPENPDKLRRLASCMRFDDGNEFLREFEGHLDAVRSIYLDSLERLRA